MKFPRFDEPGRGDGRVLISGVSALKPALLRLSAILKWLFYSWCLDQDMPLKFDGREESGFKKCA
jgi:hypothetical protein